MAVASAAATALLVGASTASARSPRALGGYGTWSLTELGYDDVVLHPRPVESQTFGRVEYRLPAGAKEGGRHWYLGHLHYVLTMRPDTPTGVVYVSAAANRWPFAQIRYRVKRRDGKPTLSSDALGLVAGQELRSAESLRSELRFENYIPYHGVRGGVNTITFMLEQYEGARVESLRIFRDSGLEISPLEPGRSQLIATAPTRPVRVGDTVRVSYRLRNLGGRAATNAHVDVRVAPKTFRVEDDSTRVHSSIPGGREVTGSFGLHALKPGRHAIEIEARAGPSRPRAFVSVRVLPARKHSYGGWWPALVAVPLLGVLAVAGVRRVH